MRKSFILHLDSLCVLDEMTNEQKGVLFNAIYKFNQGEEIELDFAMKMAFAPFKNQFVRDNGKYQEFQEKQAENGKKGGRPTKPKESQQNPENPSLLEKPKKANSVSVNDSVSNSVNKKESKNVFIAPTKLEVEVYFAENGYTLESGSKAWNYYQTGDWKDSKGNKVKNWKQKMQAVWFKEENKIQQVAQRKLSVF